MEKIKFTEEEKQELSKEIEQLEPTKKELQEIEEEIQKEVIIPNYHEINEGININTLYVNELYNYKLLTREEEQEIGQSLKLKNKSKIIKKIKRNNAKEEIEILDLEKVFSSITKENIQESFQIIKDYINESKSKSSLENKILNYYLKEYNNLFQEYIPSINDLNIHFSKKHKYNYFKKFAQEKALESKELLQQLNDYKEYKLAREKLIQHNLRLVIRHAQNNVGPKSAFLDLVEAGNLGIIKAVEKFDIDKGFKFSTYARWWIKQAIQREINYSSRTIRVPNHKCDNIRTVEKYQTKFIMEHGYPPTDEQIMKEFDYTINQFNELKIAMNQYQISLNNTKINGEFDEVSPFEEIVADPNEEYSEYDKINREYDIRILLKTMKEKLTPREIEILLFRSGLKRLPTEKFLKPYTLEEIGNYYEITRERVRQIEERAIGKLNPKLNCKVKKRPIR
jgi:RNA polymerase primary sigma factor